MIIINHKTYTKMIGVTNMLPAQIMSRSTSHICYAHRGNKNYNWFHKSNQNDDKNDYQNDDSYLLFEAKMIKKKNNPVSLYDVRDAVECCSTILNERMKSDCYMQFGVDGKMAEKYFKHIERMERQYEMPDDPIPTRDIKVKKNFRKNFRKWFEFGMDFDKE